MDNDKLHQQALVATGYWGREGAGCIIVSRSSGKILLPLRSELVQEPLTWGVFGGAIDPHEDFKETVCREAYEESGLSVLADDLVLLYEFEDCNAGFRYTTFVAFVDGEPEPTLNWESNEAKWFTFGDWPAPLHYGLKAILDDASATAILKSYCLI